jgi:hypothetical protein
VYLTSELREYVATVEDEREDVSNVSQAVQAIISEHREAADG